MASRSKLVVSFVILLSFVFTLLAYACPEWDMTRTMTVPSTAHDAMAGTEPCANAKPHNCQLVRDRMLSAGIAPAPAIMSYHTLTGSPHLIPLEAATESKMLRDRGPPLLPAFHRVFKLQLSLSHLVLRL